MGRHRVLRHADKARQLPCRDTVRFPRDKQAEGLQTRGLGKCGERRYRLNLIHISRVIDYLTLSMHGSVSLRPLSALCVRAMWRGVTGSARSGRAPRPATL